MSEEDIEMYKSGFKYNDIDILITTDIEISKKHISNDYLIIENTDMKQLMKDNFLPWLKGQDNVNMDDENILDGLKLYEISYHYDKIGSQYSPTGKEDYFGQFEFCFESGSEYTANLLEVAAMEVWVNDNKIVHVSGYDI